MTHKATIDALETLLPEIRKNPTDVEGVLLKYAHAHNLASAQLGLLARKYNTARFLTHVKTANAEDTADTIPVLDVDTLLNTYEQLPQQKQSYADLWTTPDSETDAGFLQFPFCPTESDGMKEKSASVSKTDDEQLPYYQSILPLTEAVKSAAQVVYEVDEDIKTILKKAGKLDIKATPFVFGDDVKLAETVFTGTVEYPDMRVIKAASGILGELKNLIDVREEAVRIKEAAKNKQETVRGNSKGEGITLHFEALPGGKKPEGDKKPKGGKKPEGKPGSPPNGPSNNKKNKKNKKNKLDLEARMTPMSITPPESNLETASALINAGASAAKSTADAADKLYSTITSRRKNLLGMDDRRAIVRHRSLLDNKAKRETILMDLAMTDPVISQEDPENIAEYYNAIHTLNPGITTHAALVRPILREAIQYGGIPLPTQKELARMNESAKA